MKMELSHIVERAVAYADKHYGVCEYVCAGGRREGGA